VLNGNGNGVSTSSSTILLRSHTEGIKTGCIVTLTNTHYYYCCHVHHFILRTWLKTTKGTGGLPFHVCSVLS